MKVIQDLATENLPLLNLQRVTNVRVYRNSSREKIFYVNKNLNGRKCRFQQIYYYTTIDYLFWLKAFFKTLETRTQNYLSP